MANEQRDREEKGNQDHRGHGQAQGRKAKQGGQQRV